MRFGKSRWLRIWPCTMDPQMILQLRTAYQVSGIMGFVGSFAIAFTAWNIVSHHTKMQQNSSTGNSNIWRYFRLLFWQGVCDFLYNISPIISFWAPPPLPPFAIYNYTLQNYTYVDEIAGQNACLAQAVFNSLGIFGLTFCAMQGVEIFFFFKQESRMQTLSKSTAVERGDGRWTSGCCTSRYSITKLEISAIFWSLIQYFSTLFTFGFGSYLPPAITVICWHKGEDTMVNALRADYITVALAILLASTFFTLAICQVRRRLANITSAKVKWNATLRVMKLSVIPILFVVFWTPSIFHRLFASSPRTSVKMRMVSLYVQVCCQTSCSFFYFIALLTTNQQVRKIWRNWFCRSGDSHIPKSMDVHNSDRGTGALFVTEIHNENQRLSVNYSMIDEDFSFNHNLNHSSLELGKYNMEQ